MSTNPREAYLETQVLTATPQKLRLMLIEGAIRFAAQSLKQWDEGSEQDALDSLLRCRGVVTELLVSIKTEQSEVMRKVASIYVFLFQTLTEAQVNKKRENVSEVLKVLEVERETWREICEKMPEAPDPALMQQNKPKEITVSNSEAIAQSHLPIGPSFDSSAMTAGFDSAVTPPQATPGGFSMDA